MSVFKEGDVVYHPDFGKGDVTDVHEGSQIPYRVYFDGGRGSQWIREGCLSFSPWPKPNHERPLEDGFYLVAYGGTGQFLGVYKHKTWYWADGGLMDWKGRACSNQAAITVVKFLTALPTN